MRYFMETLIWLGFFAAVFFSFYFYLKHRNRERMALIEKGVDISEIYKKRDFTFRFPWLRMGMLIVGIGVGLLVAYVLIEVPPPNFRHGNDAEEIIISFSLLIFGGLGIVVGNTMDRIAKKKHG